jgi:uncharacterized protein YkwD
MTIIGKILRAPVLVVLYIVGVVARACMAMTHLVILLLVTGALSVDGSHFDSFCRSLTHARSRRGALAALLGGTLNCLGSTDAFARTGNDKKKKKGGKKKTGRGTGRCSNKGAHDVSGLDAEELAFLGLINDYRVANGLGALAHHRRLGAAAAFHAQDMATNNYTGHVSLSGVTPEQNIRQHGYTNYSALAENTFWGLATANEALEWWKNSPGHNPTMLSSHFNEIGIGRAYNASSSKGWYWTTTFGGCGV